MQEHEFEPALNSLRHARTKVAAVCAWDALRKVGRERWFDATHAARLRRACADQGLQLPDLTLRPLEAGESWLLLYEARTGQGRVSRLRATSKQAVVEDNGILDQLERAQVGLGAALGRVGRLLPARLGPRSIQIDVVGVTGDSLGLSACIALMSRALGRAPAPDIAASAEVRPDGLLAPISHLEEKLSALARARPDVTRVVVAVEQALVASPAGIAVLGASCLEEALRLFALDPAELEGVDEHALIRELTEFALQEERELSTEGWRDYAFRARAIAELFRAHFHDEQRAAECFRWSGLFALHGGDPGLAEDLVSANDAQVCDAELTAWRAVIEASARIDTCPHEAVGFAENALQRCSAIEKARTRDELQARALGTYGRALMHAGKPESAEPHLRASVELQQRLAPREVPRSLCYLAQCFRLQARAELALAECQHGLDLTRQRDQIYARKSALFLELERGRALLALDRYVEAMSSFEAVAGAQTYDQDYPRLGALRGLAAVHRALGNVDQARDYLTRCIRVAHEQSGPLRDVAAMAVADALLAAPGEAEELRNLWLRWYGDPDTAIISVQVRSAVY